MSALALTRRFRTRTSVAACALAAPCLGGFAPVLAQTVAAPPEDPAIADILVTRYKPVDPSPAAKIDAPNHDLPITVDQVTSDLLQDRKAVSIDEALDTVAGVRLIPGFPGSSGFLVRGFFESYNTLVDGFRDSQGTNEVQGIDRIDVLKGPSSVLFGSQSGGGVVNIVTKNPLAVPSYAGEFTGGSFGERRAIVDLNQPLDDGRVLLRLNGAYEEADSFRDYVTSAGRFVAPAATFKITDADTLTLKMSYYQYDYTYFSDFPLGAVNDSQYLKVPISRWLGEPGLPQSTSHEWRVSYDYQHDFGDGWKLRSALGFNQFSVDQGLSRVYYPTLRADGRTIDRTLEQGPQQTQAVTAQEEVYGRFTTGPLTHQAIVGLEYYTEFYDYVDDFAKVGPLDIFNPVYGAKPRPTTFGYAGGSGDDNVAGYVQDLISLGNWKLLAGLRVDHNYKYSNSQNASGDVTRHRTASNTQPSPRIGLVYQPVPPTSLYFNWSRSFIPTVSRSRTNEVFPPTEGEQFEGGIKQDLLDGRLSATFALYQITRENVPTTDPANPAFSVVSGEQRSRGAEISAAGQILPAWNIFFTYAFTEAAVTKDNKLPVGQRLAGVPRHAASLWTEYELPEGPLKGLGAGFGVTYASSRSATLPYTFTLDSYARVDAALFYRFAEHYKVSLNIKNLNDVKYYDTDGGYALRPGAPITALASLRAEF